MPHPSEIESNPPVPVAVATTAPAKRGWGCWCLAGCALVPLVLALIATIYALWLTAASGVVRIPILSSMAYAKHDPIRVVQPEKGGGLSLISPDALKALEKGGSDPEALNALFSEEQMAALVKQFSKLSSGVSANQLKVDLSEGMLTGSIRQTAATVKTTNEQSAKPKKPLFDLTRAQITVSKAQGVEVYLPFDNNAQASAVRIYLRPSAVDGAVRLALTDVWIGNLHVPSSWVNALSQDGIDEALRSAAPDMKKTFILSTLDVGEGNVHLEGTFAPGAL